MCLKANLYVQKNTGVHFSPTLVGKHFKLQACNAWVYPMNFAG